MKKEEKRKERFIYLRFRLKTKKSFLQIPTKKKGIPFVSISFVSPLEEDEGEGGEGITDWSVIIEIYRLLSNRSLSPWTTDREKVFGGYASIRSEGRGGGGKVRKIGLSFRMFESQISKREEMAVAKEASDRASEEEGLERLLGLPEGDHASLLSLRIPRK